MAKEFYDKHVPSYYMTLGKDIAEPPGFRIKICEKDCGIGLSMEPFEKNPAPTSNPKVDYIGWFNIKEAQELLAGLQQAIDCAVENSDGKDPHKNRVRNP